MFTLADAVLFRPLPVPAPQRLLRIDTTDPTDAVRQARPTPGAVVEAIRAAHIFAGVCGFLTPLMTVPNAVPPWRLAARADHITCAIGTRAD